MKLKDLLRSNCDEYTTITGMGTANFKITLIGCEKNLIDVEVGEDENTITIETCESELRNLMIGIGRFLDNINKEIK